MKAKRTIRLTAAQLWDRKRTLETLCQYEFEAIMYHESPFSERDMQRWERELDRINSKLRGYHV